MERWRVVFKVKFPANKLVKDIIAILKEKHYLDSYEVINKDKKHFAQVKIKHDKSGRAVFREIKFFSKSSLRIYCKVKKIPRIKNGFATVIMSTSLGVMTGKEARKKNVGGEPICYIF